MAYNKQEIFEKSKAYIVQHNLIFIEDIVAYLPCDKTTFYRLFPMESQEMNGIKSLLGKQKSNRILSERVPRHKSNIKGYVYLVHCKGTNYYKIGASKSPYKDRLVVLQSGCPFDLIMLHASHSINYKESEEQAHSYFRNSNHKDEWFEFKEEEIISVIEKIDEISKSTTIK